MAEGLGDLVTAEIMPDGHGREFPALLIRRGDWAVLATDQGSFVAMALRLALAAEDVKAIAALSANDRQSVIHLIEDLSCQGRTASMLEIESPRESLRAIVLEQRVFEPDGSAAMNQRIADGLQEVIITAIRVYAALARALISVQRNLAKGPSSDPGGMFR